MDTFQWNLDDDKEVLDSMCYDGGTMVCNYGTDDDFVQVTVDGEVRVIYKDAIYKYFSNMPEELQNKFKEGQWPDWEEAQIWDNNWLEISYIRNGDYVGGDVFDIATPATREEVEKACKEVLQEWREWVEKEKKYESKGTN